MTTTALDTTRPPTAGSISTGTLRIQDLLDAFASELEAIEGPCRLATEALDAIEGEPVEGGDADWDEWQEAASYLLDELQDALNDHAPEGLYFGTLEGDGADFGFWPVEEEDT